MAFLSAVVSWSLHNRPVVFLATLLFVIVGVHAMFTLPIDAVPDITSVQVQVITSAPALSPVEIEQYVTVPVERAMAGLPKTNEVRSISKYGLSVVTIVFDDGTDIYFARQMVNERMREAQDAVSTGHGKPQMGPISSGLGEVYQFVLRNPRLSLMQLEELLDWQVSPQLRTVPGVVEVNSFGGEDKQYQVILDPGRLQAAGVSVAEVVKGLEQSNSNAGGGYIEHNREHFVIGSKGLVKDLDDLKRVVIGATPEGIPITIATVGDVQLGPRLRRGAATRDGKGEVVIGVAMMLLGENSLSVTEAIKKKIEVLVPSLPQGTIIEPFYDRSQLVTRTVQTVGKNLLEGALLIIAVLLLLLGDWRAGLVVATVIPLSLLFAITLMHPLGLSGNLMSLGAIDFGLMVDGAVIIVENSVRRLSERQRLVEHTLSATERIGVVEEATLEVRSASVFGEVIIAIVYLPILALTATEGKLFRPMAITVLLALAGAFILSLTWVPVLTSLWVRPKVVEQETWLVRKLHGFYVPALAWAMRFSWVTMGVTVILLATTVALFTQLGAEFVPQLDEGELLIEARRLPGVALSESVRTDLRIEKSIASIPEINHAIGRIGAPELATDPMGLEQSDIYITLKDRAHWRPGITKDHIAQAITEHVERSVPEAATGISQPIQMRTNELVAGIRSDVAALVYGRDLEELKRLGESLARALRPIDGVVDLRVEQSAGLRYLSIVPDRARLARYGFTIEDINRLTATIAVGYHVGEVVEGERRFAMVVKTSHGYNGDLDTLRALPLLSVSGQVVPLGDVAELSFAMGPAQVSRSNQSRRLTVEFNVRGRDVLSVVHDAQRAVARQIKLPTGYRVEWGGQFEHYIQAKTRLLVVVPLALALILFMLWLAFRSAIRAWLIFLHVPFAVIGGVVALWIRDIPFSISSGIGFIALFGVAVLNGVVLVAFAHHLENQGLQPGAAIQKAAELRLRPVLLTAFVASLGFLPMAFSSAPGSEVQRPLATVVIGGLVSATLLTLFVLPTMYARVYRKTRKVKSAS